MKVEVRKEVVDFKIGVREYNVIVVGKKKFYFEEYDEYVEMFLNRIGKKYGFDVVREIRKMIERR